MDHDELHERHEHHGHLPELLVQGQHPDELPPADVIDGTSGQMFVVPVQVVAPVQVEDHPARSVTTGQITCGAKAVQLVGARPSRVSLHVRNVDATNPLYLLASSSDSAAGGYWLPAGGFVTLSTRYAVWVIAPTGAPVATFLAEHLDG